VKFRDDDDNVKAWHQENPHSLYNAARSGEIVLIQDPGSMGGHGVGVYLLCQDQRGNKATEAGEGNRHESIPVFVKETVLVAKLDDTFAAGLDATKELATEAANHETTTRLFQLRDDGIGEDEAEYQTALNKTKDFLKKQAVNAYTSDKRFRDFTLDSLGISSGGERMWGAVPYQIITLQVDSAEFTR
jgi:hypothetical protein